MEHSKNFEKVKNYYDNGLWSEERVRAAVGKWITEEEAEEIVGEEEHIKVIDHRIEDLEEATK